MVRDDKIDLGQIPHEYAGEWVAWDRDRRRILGSGHTFEAAKRAAAAAGESSVLLAKIPTSRPLHRRRRWIYAVAVFISVLQGGAGSLLANDNPTASGGVAPAASDAPSDFFGDDSVADEDK